MTLVVIGSLVMAAVFAVASVAKLRDLPGSREAMRGFGVPAAFVAPLGVAVPLAELGVAACLIAGPTRTLGAIGATALLAAFSLAIAWNLARGRAPDCHCFGQLHSAPAGPATLSRNAALIVLAVVVASGGDLIWSAVAGAAAFALAAAGWVLSRRAAPAAPPRGLAIGTPAPSFERLPSLLGQGKPVLLLFSDPQCGPCQELAPHVANWQRVHADEVTIGVIEGDGASEIADAYGARGTPTAILVDTDGRVASPVAGGSAGIEDLMARTVTGFEPHPVEAEGGSAWTVPVRLGGPLVRRELLVRGAAASAAAAVFSLPARALGTARVRRAPRCERDRDCPRGTACRGGRCVCNGNGFPDRCAGDCTNFDADGLNCGGCNRPCPEGTVCAGGNCITGDGSTCVDCFDGICCQGACVSPGADESCGGCGIVCPHGQTCCFGRCVDERRDPRYCGGCIDGRRCGPGQVCHAGRCRDECPRPLRQCGTTCGNPNTQICCGHRVVIDRDDIDNGLVKCCGGQAIEVRSDVNNCGSCGCRCVGRQECTCENGKCVCGPNPLDGSCFFSP